MNVIESINKAKGDTLFSFEILPPLQGSRIKRLYAGFDPLMEFKPSFINVTYHREEYVYKKQSNGLLKRSATRKRLGTVGICAAIKNKYKVEAVPHLTYGGFSIEETEDALIDLNFLGINNVLALRRDPIKSEPNQLISVAGYPEKHYESMSPKTDLKYLKEKVDAGAEYIVTQMFFDNQKYFDFVEKCREIGIEVPVIPGLKPLTKERHISFIPKTFNIDFPEALASELEKCKDDSAICTLDTEWCIQQSRELKAAGVPSLHYFTMGTSKLVKEIVSAVYYDNFTSLSSTV